MKKFCIDCRHRIGPKKLGDLIWQCGEADNPVTGEKVVMTCDEMRAKDGACSPSGALWDPACGLHHCHHLTQLMVVNSLTGEDGGKIEICDACLKYLRLCDDVLLTVGHASESVPYVSRILNNMPYRNKNCDHFAKDKTGHVVKTGDSYSVWLCDDCFAAVSAPLPEGFGLIVIEKNTFDCTKVRADYLLSAAKLKQPQP